MSRIPAGILDNHVEFFDSPKGLMAFVGGQALSWQAVPIGVKIMVRKDLEKHPEALDRLAHLPADAQLASYAKCKWGGLSQENPDLMVCGTSYAEHWDCQCTGCPLKLVLRGKIKVANGHLSEREIEIAQLIAQGFFGKEICARLEIAESTFNTHKRHIFEKVGVTSGIELTNWANKIHLI